MKFTFTHVLIPRTKSRTLSQRHSRKEETLIYEKPARTFLPYLAYAQTLVTRSTSRALSVPSCRSRGDPPPLSSFTSPFRYIRFRSIDRTAAREEIQANPPPMKFVRSILLAREKKINKY